MAKENSAMPRKRAGEQERHCRRRHGVPDPDLGRRGASAEHSQYQFVQVDAVAAAHSQRARRHDAGLGGESGLEQLVLAGWLAFPRSLGGQLLGGQLGVREMSQEPDRTDVADRCRPN
jgi:hypothetical protein